MHIQDAVLTPEGRGFLVYRVVTPQAPCDPFLLLDDTADIVIPKGDPFPAGPHPHRGFETVTYVLKGVAYHKDSMGREGAVGAGGVEWMRAGSGLVHDLAGDWPPSDGTPLQVLQLWVNLPAADKFLPPAFAITEPEDVPVALVPGGTVRVIADRFGGTVHRGGTHLAITYLHVRLERGALDVPHNVGDNAFVYVLAGAGRFNETPVAAHQRVDVDAALTVTTETGIDMIYLSAPPLREPIVVYGPFVMNTREEIAAAFADYHAGKMSGTSGA